MKKRIATMFLALFFLGASAVRAEDGNWSAQSQGGRTVEDGTWSAQASPGGPGVRTPATASPALASAFIFLLRLRAITIL